MSGRTPSALPFTWQCPPGNRQQSIATQINQGLTQAPNWHLSCTSIAQVLEFGMKNCCRNRLALFVFVSITSIVAVCQTNSSMHRQMGSTANCQNIGPTVTPASGPSPWLPKIAGRDQLPGTPTSCTPPQTPSVAASDARRAPATNDPPKPDVNNTLPSPATVSAPARTPSMRLR